MRWLLAVVALFLSILVAGILIGVWATVVSYQSGFILATCITSGYAVNAQPTPCLQKCCAFDANGYCVVACNCWLGVILVNVSTVIDAPLQTGTFSSISQADMVNTLQNTYPLGQNFTCYYTRNNPGDVQLPSSVGGGNPQETFIAAMVFFGIAGFSALMTVYLCFHKLRRK